MQDFIFRDNVELLKTKPCFVSKAGEYTVGMWSSGKEPPDVQLYKPPSPFRKIQVNCPHCGFSRNPRGLGAHMRSLVCLAERARLQAYLEGYVLAPIQYCNLTSPFARRYPTSVSKVPKIKGTISMQAFYESWFAELWLAHARDQADTYTSQVPNIPPIQAGPMKTGQVLQVAVIHKRTQPQQRPPAHVLPCFQELAAAKRRNSKRGIQQALTNLQLTLALVDK